MNQILEFQNIRTINIGKFYLGNCFDWIKVLSKQPLIKGNYQINCFYKSSLNSVIQTRFRFQYNQLDIVSSSIIVNIQESTDFLDLEVKGWGDFNMKLIIQELEENENL